MSGKITTPVNQVRFTNVAVVRLKKGGKRFEIACYKNKVVEWRDKITTDIDEVLQTPTIFTNVSKGMAAKKDELKKCFGTTDEQKIVLMILEKGEMQVSGEERKRQLDSLFRDIATIVAEKCVNPENQRPLTVGLVEKAMRDIHYSVKPSKSAKQQALDVIRLLKQKSDFPIARAYMRLKVATEIKDTRKVNEALTELVAKSEKEETGEKFEMTILIDPGNYRRVEEAVKKATKSTGSVEVVTLAVHEQGDESIE
jgi:ribosome maturation protein SDO1